MDGPLSGIKVLAFEQAIALPFSSLVLAEMGAEVIKIERPGSGDVVRGWDHAVKGLSSGYVAFNVGKRNLALDVSKAEGRKIVHQLVGRSDVFLENFAPGVAGRLGLGWDTLRQTNPRLIYCSLSGYGQDGPYRDVKAFDLLIQGESGVLTTNGTKDALAKVGMPITDLIGGAHVVFGILGALLERHRTGEGTYLDVALLESTFFWLGYFPHYEWHGLPQPPLRGMRHQFICPYGPFAASDGKFVNVAVASQQHWGLFCEHVLGRKDLIDDPRFATMADRNQNNDALESIITTVFSKFPHDHWMGKLERAGLPHGLVRDMSEVVSHPQLAHREMVVEVGSPVGPIPAVRMPCSPISAPRRVPALGEDTALVLEELGYDKSDISRLAGKGVIALQGE